jgi:hypothetical protein
MNRTLYMGSVLGCDWQWLLIQIIAMVMPWHSYPLGRLFMWFQVQKSGYSISNSVLFVLIIIIVICVHLFVLPLPLKSFHTLQQQDLDE